MLSADRTLGATDNIRRPLLKPLRSRMDSPNPVNQPNQNQGPPRRPLPKRERRFDEPPRPMSAAPWLVLIGIVTVTLFWFSFKSPGNTGTRVSLLILPQGGRSKGTSRASRFTGKSSAANGRKSRTNLPPDVTKMADEFNFVLPPGISAEPNYWDDLREKGIEVDAEPREPSYAQQMIFYLVGFGALVLFLMYIMRRNVDPLGGGMMGNFIRSQAKRFQPSEQRTTFQDVAALEQAKLELQEIVEFLKSPAKFERLGAQIPKGVLLMGPPGTGKTLLARAVAGEAGVPFFSINGSEFIQMFVGVGASRVRDLFRTAKESSPCILFIDEIDAVGRERGAGFGGGHDEREQTLNQILSEMDGFLQTEAVIVLAATNRPDVLDPALLRPGRFDRHVTIDRPTRDGRIAILKVHCKKVPLSDDVDLDSLGAGNDRLFRRRPAQPRQRGGPPGGTGREKLG